MLSGELQVRADNTGSDESCRIADCATPPQTARAHGLL
jgi:hypothetical protein